MSFTSLGLSASLLHAVNKQGYTQPSPIQQQAIPVILQKRDVLASAQTGTGKTAGFTLPLLQLLSEKPQKGKRPIRALVLTPTRELAAQVAESVETYGEFLTLKSAVIFGGVGANPQIQKLRRGVDILIATPGRLLDLHGQGEVDLRDLEVLILDEADRMLDMGFVHDIKRILNIVPPRRQNLLFSATFSPEIRTLANGILHNPVEVKVDPENTTTELVKQRIYKVDKERKPELVIKLIEEGNWQQVLIFTRTKHGANRLSKKLEQRGITSAPIHGNKSQTARTQALKGFKEGSVRVMVATDIAARGLDIPLLPHVVNFELPNVAEDYVHRIGRTGRAGANGEAISLVSADEMDLVRNIERLTKQRINSEVVPGFEPDPNAPTEDPDDPRHARNRGKRPGSRRPEQRTPGQASSSGRNNRFKKPANNNANASQRPSGEAGPERPRRRLTKFSKHSTGAKAEGSERQSSGNQATGKHRPNNWRKDSRRDNNSTGKSLEWGSKNRFED
jgi:ATP-dependent RNA helicase RhlE